MHVGFHIGAVELSERCHCIGTLRVFEEHPALGTPIDGGEEDDATKTTCNKDTGEKRRLQKWTRGVWTCVSAFNHGNRYTSKSILIAY